MPNRSIKDILHILYRRDIAKIIQQHEKYISSGIQRDFCFSGLKSSRAPLEEAKTGINSNQYLKMIGKFSNTYCTVQDKHDTAEFEHLDKLFQDIGNCAQENVDYFADKEKRDFIQSFQAIINVIEPLQISLGVVTNCCDKFDINPNCKGNGYRSVINIVESCLRKILATCKHIQKSRDKLFFRSYHMYMELESYVQVLSRLLTICNFAIVLLDYSKVGNLFPEDTVMDDMISDFEKINRECFYGRTFGFQYSDSIRQAMQVIGVAMAAYGDGYKQHNHSFTRALSSMLHSGKYMVNPELRAQRITELTQSANIDFCKAFWSLTEEYGVQHAPLLLCPAMAVNQEFDIPDDPVEITTNDSETLTIEFPYLHSEHSGIKCRLLSYAWREGQKNGVANGGMPSTLGPKPSKKSRYLMIHCHGGGFVAQSSKSHEMYLRYWAKELQIPILSIDYSLAPDAPYPQAVNEVYFAYIWALKNLEKLGTTGEKICFSGDSAGANLVTAITLKAIKGNIRLPDSIVVAYPPYRLQFLPSPSRMLCLMDPLLPLGVLKSCIQAYSGVYRKEQPKRVDSFSFDGMYNAYDLDLGHVSHQNGTSRRSKLDTVYSYSETQLNIIKEKFRHSKAFDEDSSFCSEFPYSETESSFCSDADGETQSLDDFQCLEDKSTQQQSCNMVDTNCTDLKASDHYEQDKEHTNASSVLSQFTSQVSSTVQGLKSGVADYFYGGELNKQPDGMHKEQILSSSAHPKTSSGKKTDDIPPSVESTKHETQPSTRKRSLEVAEKFGDQRNDVDSKTELPHKSIFSICKVCLDRTENCTCSSNDKSPRMVRRRAERNRKIHRHYRFSHHHLTNYQTTSRVRSNSFSHKDDSEVNSRERSATLCDADVDEDTALDVNESSSTPCSPTTKNKQLLGLRLSLLSHPELSRKKTNSNNNLLTVEQSSSSPNLSPRVLYDKTAGTCKILSPDEEENNYKVIDSDTPGVEDDNQMYGTSSQVFQCAKDPFMSPYLADDELLQKLPPITIVACALDPLLDDSVEFVRKLHQLNNTAELYVLDQLPHGFLNFQPFSSDAREGCDLLIACIKKSLQMGMRRVDSTASFRFKK